MADKPATVTIDVAGATVSAYSLPRVKPDSYQWQDVIASDTDTTETYQMHVNGGVSIS